MTQQGDGDGDVGSGGTSEPGGNGGSGGTSSESGGAPSSVGGTGVGGEASGGQGSGGTPQGSVEVRVMSYNIYGHATMPQEASTYAAKINAEDVDVLGIQEGVDDWQVPSPPTDYSRSEALQNALNATENCWDRQYQIFVNTCRGNAFVSHERFDLTDGPNAVRTGEVAVVSKGGKQYVFVDVHWDHEDAGARANNALETAAEVNSHQSAAMVVGDLNTSCSGTDATSMANGASLDLVENGGIDCIFSKGASGSGQTIDGAPSDHPAVIATFDI